VVLLHYLIHSSTTFVKHFIAQVVMLFIMVGDFTVNDYVAGYCNTTTAIDAIQFNLIVATWMLVQ
jgi:hypothetical protein